jgi:hypothetical protein
MESTLLPIIVLAGEFMDLIFVQDYMVLLLQQQE